MKNRDIHWRRYKIRETLYKGQWCFSPLQSRHLRTSHSSPNHHQLSHCIFLNLIDGLKSLPFLFYFFLNILFIYFYREEKGGRKRGRETSVCERHIDLLPLTCPQLGTWPATQACALTGNRTCDLMVHNPALGPLSHTSQGKISSLSKVVLVFGKARSHRAPNLGCSRAGSPGWFDVLPKNSAQDMKHEQVHCHDKAASHQWPIAAAFWIIWTVSAVECSSLMQSLVQICCSTCSVILNVVATQHTGSVNDVYHPHWLVQWTRHYSHMCIPVHSPWLPGYTDVTQTVLIILTMAGLFLDRPLYALCITSLFYRWVNWGEMLFVQSHIVDGRSWIHTEAVLLLLTKDQYPEKKPLLKTNEEKKIEKN